MAGATHYAIWFINRDTNTVLSGATGLTDASYTHGSPLVDGNYRIWVRAYNAAGSSAWSRRWAAPGAAGTWCSRPKKPGT